MKRIFQVTTIITYTLLFASCGNKDGDKKEAKPAQATIYATMPLQPHAISGNVQLPGVMQPFEFVQLFPRVNGFVKTVSVDRGSVVRAGQVLITLDAPEVEQQVAAARLKYTQAQSSYLTSKDRYQRLLETSKTPGTVSPFDLQAAQSRMQGDSATAQGEYANYMAQESMRAYLTVTAPFDGVITERNVHPGALAGPGMLNNKPMLVLQQLSKLRMVVDIPEQYAAQIKNGDSVHYKLNALPGKDFAGVVSRSSQSLSSNYRAEVIEVDVQNTANAFKPGMYAEVVLPTSGNVDAFVVPSAAVVSTTEKKYVVLADNGAAKLVDVSTGSNHGDSTEIYGLLHTGDNVIVNPSYRIKNGDAISGK